MEAAFALLLPLVGGYLFAAGWNARKFTLARDEGHRLYFRVAYYGLMLFLASTLLLGAAYKLLCATTSFQTEIASTIVEAIKPLLKDPASANAQIAFMSICLGSVALGRLSPVALNLLSKKTGYEAVWEAAKEDELEEFLMEALALLKTISITLSSNKVYVGIVLTTPEPRTERRVIALLPYMSGYRTEAGKVNFTTFYDEAYKDLDGAETDYFKLLLPIDKMLSISFFDVAMYAKFNASDSEADESVGSESGGPSP